MLSSLKLIIPIVILLSITGCTENTEDYQSKIDDLEDQVYSLEYDLRAANSEIECLKDAIDEATRFQDSSYYELNEAIGSLSYVSC